VVKLKQGDKVKCVRTDQKGDRTQYNAIRYDAMQHDTMTELRVSPNGVSHSAEKRFENTGSSRSSSTDLEGESEEDREAGQE
jgi:hypothetical protein